MELRGQDKDIGMPSSVGYHHPPQPNQDSSSKLSSAPIISTLPDRRRNELTGHGSTILIPTQTLDHHTLHHHHHQLNPQLQQLQQQTQRPGRDPNPDPDPAQLASATIIAAASNSKTPLPATQSLQLQPQAQATAAPTNSTPSIRYRECLKNHAASMGGHVVDGCGEFMPSGEEGTPEALKCAACDCHRNFHCKEIDGESRQHGGNCYYTYNPNRNSGHRTTIHPTQPPPSLPALPPQHHHRHSSHAYAHGLTTSPTTGPIHPMMMAFGGSSGAPAESSSEDLNMFQSISGAHPLGQPSCSVSKKRFRTKFTQEQKDRMHEFAEKIGWKIQRQDEQEVQQLCNDVGVQRQVFKVWMHNNKQAMKKKQL